MDLLFLQCFRRDNAKAFKKAEEELSSLDPPCDPEVLKHNQERMEKIFQNLEKTIVNDLRKKRDKAINEMATLTQEQQEDLITFWGGMAKVLKEVFKWIGRMFDRMVDLLRQGWRLIKETTKKFFDSVISFFKNLF